MSNLTIEQYSDSPEGFEGKTINVGDVGDTITLPIRYLKIPRRRSRNFAGS